MDEVTTAAVPAGLPPQASLDDFDSVLAEMDAQPRANIKPPPNPTNAKGPDPLANLTEEQAREQLEALERGEDPNAQEQSPEEAPPEEQQNAAPQMAEDERALFEKWKAERESPMLAEDALERLVEVPDGKGGFEPVTVAELKRGYLRNSDATKKWTEAAEMRKESDTTKGNLNRFLGECRDPERFIERWEDMGYGDVLDQVAQKRFEEFKSQKIFLHRMKSHGATDEDLRAMEQMFVTSRQAARDKRLRERQLAAQQQRQQQEQQQTQNLEQRNQLKNALAQLRPAAFKASGIPDDALHRQVFQDQFIAIAQFGNAKDIREAVMMATAATKEFVAARVSEHAAKLAEQRKIESQQKGAQLPPRSAGTAPAQKLNPGAARPQLLSVDDFDAEMERQNAAGWAR